jgi:hypothetical protein
VVVGELLPAYTPALLGHGQGEEVLFRKEGAYNGTAMGRPGEWRWKNPALIWAGDRYVLLVSVRTAPRPPRRPRGFGATWIMCLEGDSGGRIVGTSSRIAVNDPPDPRS